MNNNFMRQGSGNRNRNNRNNNNNNNRNRHRTGGGGGGGPNNKVFDSNGPDVKVRGTAQTIAEKYMQLGRDAQSSGDNVAAESYYQHAEHYYRVWASNQPVGASLIMSRKLGEEEYEEEGGEDLGDDEGQELPGVEGVAPEGLEAQEGAPVEGQQEGQNQQRRFNNNRNRDETRDGQRQGEQRDGNRERFRPKWQQRGRDRYNQDGTIDQQSAPQIAEGEVPVAVEAAPIAAQVVEQAVSAQWEAPSFLQRPAPVMAADVPVVAEVEAAPVKRTRTRKPRVEEQAQVEDAAAPAAE